MARSGLFKGRVYALEQHLKAHILMLKEELELFFESAVAVPGHADFFKSVEDKVCELAEYEGALESLNKHFKE